MILVYFPSGGCVDDVTNSRAYYEFTSVIAINGAGVCWIIRRTVFNMSICKI